MKHKFPGLLKPQNDVVFSISIFDCTYSSVDALSTKFYWHPLQVCLAYSGTGLFLLRGVQWMIILTAFSNPLRA